MRHVSYVLLVAPILAFPGRLDQTNCAQVLQIIGGTAPTIMNVASVPGNALVATAAGVQLTQGGTYSPGSTITLANEGGGQYGLYADAGTLAGATLCGGKLITAGGQLTAPLTGPLNLVGMRAPARGVVTYELITLQTDGGTPPPDGGIDGGIGGLSPPPPGGVGIGNGQGAAVGASGDPCGNGAGGSGPCDPATLRLRPAPSARPARPAILHASTMSARFPTPSPLS